MRMLREKSDAGRADRTRATLSAGRQAGWAAAYLLAAGALIAIAGTELSGPSPEARARALERETARELAAVVETASAVARSRFEEDRRRVLEREKGREATLRAALAGVRSWARQLGSPIDDADVSPGGLSVSKDPFSPAAADLAPLLPDGVVAAIVAPSGEKLFETGGELDLDSPRALMAPLGGGFTAAVDCPGGTPPSDCGFADSLRETLRRYLVRGLAPGTGLYFVSEDGCVVAEVSARPTAFDKDTQDVERRVSCPSCPSLLNAVAVRGVVKSVTGDLETGRLVSARAGVGLSAHALPRRPTASNRDAPGLRSRSGYYGGVGQDTQDVERHVSCPSCPSLLNAVAVDPSSVLAWTAVAERFLSPDALAAGSGDLAGMLALTGLGVVAAAAFAHAFYTGFAKGPPSTARRPQRSQRPQIGDERQGMRTSETVEVSRGMTDRGAEPVPQGRSIVRLRESLGAAQGNDTGAPGWGPDLAACARSPILRALSRCVRHPGPALVPREVKEWARQANASERGHRKRVA